MTLGINLAVKDDGHSETVSSFVHGNHGWRGDRIGVLTGYHHG